jgi:hypothetical protein
MTHYAINVFYGHKSKKPSYVCNDRSLTFDYDPTIISKEDLRGQ